MNDPEHHRLDPRSPGSLKALLPSAFSSEAEVRILRDSPNKFHPFKGGIGCRGFMQ